MNKRAVIISGGSIEADYALRILQEKKYDYVIGADRGLLFLREHQIWPTHIVGDFDSADPSVLEAYRNDPADRSESGEGETTVCRDSGQQADFGGRRKSQVEIRRFRPEKDWTDTEIAANLAAELGCGEVDILGATGSRMDHVLGNIQVLALMLEKNIFCRLMDSHNVIYLVNKNIVLRRTQQSGKYVSLFAYGGDVRGLTLEGFKYPVRDFTLGSIGTRGVSNEIVLDCGRISFKEGRLLVVESRD